MEPANLRINKDKIVLCATITICIALLIVVLMPYISDFFGKPDIKDFTYSIYDNEVTITKYIGKKTEVVIPSKISGNTVTSIDSHAFANCKNIISVKIPNEVNSIGDCAFSDCSSLTSVILPGDTTSIESSTFLNCESLESIVIPNNVASIDYNAFDGCTSLANVTIPQSVVSISADAFKNTPWIDNNTDDFIIVNNILLKYQGSDEMPQIPSGITVIAGRAFESNKIITSIAIPNSVIAIDYSSFLGCSNLKDVTIPPNLASINGNAFHQTAWFDAFESDFVVVNDVLLGYKGDDSSITVPNGVIAIGDHSFLHDENLISITLSDSVTSIGASAFWHCTSLKDITIPDSVTSIGKSAFSDCPNLTNITLPSNITSISNFMFKGAENLAAIIIPNGVSAIGSDAFWGCKSLTSIIIPSTVTSIDRGAFFRCENLQSAFFEGDAPKKVGTGAFRRTADGFRIYYQEGANGWINPWNGYVTEESMPLRRVNMSK